MTSSRMTNTLYKCSITVIMEVEIHPLQLHSNPTAKPPK
jgi:hypothetical protein